MLHLKPNGGYCIVMKRIGIFISVLVLGCIALLAPIHVPKAQAASCPDKPYMTVSPTIDVSGDYAVWIQEKRESTSKAVVSISNDGGKSCSSFAKSSGGDWAWKTGSSGTLKKSFSAGEASIRLYIDNGVTLLSNLLLTLDTKCTPTGDGSNCVRQPISMSVKGIDSGSTISGSVTIQTYINTKTVDPVRVEYYFDKESKPFSTSSSSPYCLVLTAGNCAGWPSSSLFNGSHKLTIRAVSGTEPTKK